MVTATDNIAIGVLHAAYALRLAIPEQVSVVGFDDIPLAAFTAPPLTTVRNPVSEMAGLAVDLAIDRPSPEPVHHLLVPGFTVRATTGPAPGLMSSKRYTIGVDFGTLSGRAVVVSVDDGAEVGSAVHEYRHGVLERRLDVAGTSGPALPPDWALQVPHDYVEVLQQAVPAAVRASGIDPADVIGIGTDFTACTVLPALDDGTPLCELPELADRPHAYAKLWKHHAAQPQADRINELAAERGEPWLARYGGKISSEWEFAKGLQLLEEDPEVYGRTRHWVEAADWIVWQLTDVYVRNACTAGYKAIYQDGAYPSADFLAALDPDFAGFVTDKVERPIAQLGEPVGALTAAAAAWTGLPAGIAVCAGNVDAHVSAPAANAIEPGQMVAIMGTSTCHIMSSDVLAEVPGHVRGRGGRHRARPVGLRGGAERRRRHLRLVRRQPAPLARTTMPRRPPASTSTSTSPTSRPACRSAATVSWRSTGTAATAPCSSTTTCPAWSSGSP